MEHTNGEAIKTIFEGECEKYGMLKKTIAFVSDEGKNLETCIKPFETSILCTDISSPIVQGPFQGLCNAHMISKSIGRVFVKQDKDAPAVDSDLSLIDVQSAKKKLQSNTTYTKKSGKGRHLWEQAQKDKGLPPTTLIRPVKTGFGSSLSMFVQAVEKKEALQHMFTNLVDQKNRNRVMTDDGWFVIEYLI